jgi:hypothetical protein
LLRKYAKSLQSDVAYRRLRADIEHFRGIAFSQVGGMDECFQAYMKSVRYAADPDCFGPRDALSLGYLAYELRFTDIEAAEALAKRAADLAAKLRDDGVRAKNLCSLGQIQSFMDKIEESKKNFRLARRLAGPDARESGRILVNSVVTYIAAGEWDEVDKRLSLSDTLSGRSGDRRRRAIADAYRGILEYRTGQTGKGQERVLDAFRKHREMGTQREAIYEALTYAWMIADGHMRGLDISGLSGLPRDVRRRINSATRPKYAVFVEFWANHYRPALLGE